MQPTYRRPAFRVLADRLREPRRFIQVLAGPRQAGKTTLVRQVLDALDLPTQYASADDPTLRDRTWIEQQWEIGRSRATEGSAVIVLDEVQKVTDWSEVVKRLWDEDTAAGRDLHVALLGSAPLLVHRGLSESLAGRFELTRLPHWSLEEMRDAFGWSLERFLFFGGYPGAADLPGDEDRWRRYILDSLVETTISRDILLLTRVHKPALLRRLFDLACAYSGQVLSYQKMLGQLQDAGNTTTLAHYLDLLGGAGMVVGLEKFSAGAVRRRRSSPKLQVLNTALMTATSGRIFEEARGDPEWWGRLVESAVGAHLVNSLTGTRVEVRWWREGNREVDFVLRAGDSVVGIEVKSGRSRTVRGMAAFRDAFDVRRTLLVGGDGIPLDEFLATPAAAWVDG